MSFPSTDIPCIDLTQKVCLRSCILGPGILPRCWMPAEHRILFHQYEYPPDRHPQPFDFTKNRSQWSGSLFLYFRYWRHPSASDPEKGTILSFPFFASLTVRQFFSRSTSPMSKRTASPIRIPVAYSILTNRGTPISMVFACLSCITSRSAASKIFFI